jgi:hypothetical protein
MALSETQIKMKRESAFTATVEKLELQIDEHLVTIYDEDKGSYDFIITLPEDTKIRILKELGTRYQKAGWALSLDGDTLTLTRNK